VLFAMTKFERPLLLEACYKGAVWLQKEGKGKTLKARSTEIVVGPKDVVTFFYESHILKLPELIEAKCLFENQYYGVWVKEPGVVSQGTQTGDHSSLLRFVEKQKKKPVYLIHRLDRETHGIMLIGYTSDAAGKLSKLFIENKIQKTYEAIVLGDSLKSQTITHSLDGKEATSHVEVIESKDGKSHVRVKIDTGRLHQIRRHLEFVGHPVMGDPKYGRGNKNKDGLKLVATELVFEDPWTRNTETYTLPSGFAL
jgi:tRNA pseudouridine32 synthase/23S rRNA pseudouridine746 synthase